MIAGLIIVGVLVGFSVWIGAVIGYTVLRLSVVPNAAARIRAARTEHEHAVCVRQWTIARRWQLACMIVMFASLFGVLVVVGIGSRGIARAGNRMTTGYRPNYYPDRYHY